MAFFVGWELWQDMSFILACLIAIVFVVAFFNLWRTTRMLRRHELLDEEKRARISELQRSGITIPQINDIPFGSRAIQHGIEVDEIWISRANTPAPSKRASSATVFDEGSTDYTDQGRQVASSTHKMLTSIHIQATAGTGRSIGSVNFPRHSALLVQNASESTVYDERDTSNLVPSPTLTGRHGFPKTKRSGLQSSGEGVQTASAASLAVASPFLADLADPRSEPTATTEDLANKVNLTAARF